MFETMGEPRVIHMSGRRFIEIAQKRAVLPDGEAHDFVLISRGTVGKGGARRTDSRVSIPAAVVADVVAYLAPGGIETNADAAADLAGA